MARHESGDMIEDCGCSDCVAERTAREAMRPDDGSTPKRPRVMPNRDAYTRAMMPRATPDGPVVDVWALRDWARS